MRETEDPLLVHGIEYGRPLGQQKCSEHLLEASWEGLGGNEGNAATSGRLRWEAPRGASVVYFYPATVVTEAQTLEMTQLCVNKD